MLRYEALFLAVPEITADESSNVEVQFHELISKNNGETLSFERWGKYRLAYEVRKNEYGVYYLARFEVPAEKPADVLEKLRQFFAVKNNDLVMRHTLTRLEADASLEYKRPESLEEAPRRDVDSFLKENKMTGLMRDKKEARVESVKENKAEEAQALAEETTEEQS